ncbi:helix-turn-helix transcriptional regulator [Intrasporangium mesophilum]
MPYPRSRVMVGRDTELSHLLDLAEDARGSRGSVVIISGEAGVGKSRLVAELTDRIRGRDLVVFGHGVELSEGDVPFGVLADSVRDIVRQVGLEEVRGRLGHAAEHLSGIVPSLGGGTTLDRVLVLGAALTLIDELSADRMLCWVVEDLQWADRMSRDLFTVAARSVGARRQLLVGSVRAAAAYPESVGSMLADVQSQPHAHTIHLGRLDEARVREQISGIGRPDMTLPLTERIVDLAQGLPLHVEQLVASLDDVGSQLPLSLRQIVLARLPHLSAPARRLVEAAALAGGPLDLVGLRSAAGLSEVEFDASIDEAVRGGVLGVSHQTASITFVHALVSEAVAATVLPSRRRELHRAWARAIEGRVRADAAAVFALAHHWFQAGDAPAALDAACRAALAAAEIGDAALESLHWTRALDLWPQVPDAEAVAAIGRNEILYGLAIATMASGHWAELLEIVNRERALTRGDADPVGPLWLTLCAEGARARLDGPVSVDHRTTRDRATTLLGAAPDLRAADALQRNARAARRFDPRLADEQHRVALDMAEALGHRKARLRAAVFVGFDAQVRARPRPEADRMAALAAQFQDAPVADRLLISTVQLVLLVGSGYSREAIDLAERVLAPIRAPHLIPVRYATVTFLLARAHLDVGDWTAAQRLVDVLRTVPGFEDEADSTAMRLLVTRGEIAGVPELLSRVEPTLQVDADPFEDGPYLGDAVLALYAVGHAAVARRLLCALDGDPGAWRAATVWPALNASLRAETAAHTARPADPAPDGFVERLDATAARLQWDCPAADAFRAEHAALMASHRGAEVPADWAAAADAWALIGWSWDEAVCRLRLAESVAGAGDRHRALTETLTALATADRLGAAPLRTEILAFAHRARLPLPSDARERPTGPDHLTVREREVLSLVADGRSNNEIAHELNMSPKTASVHVSRILAKLHASNRTEAAAIARRTLLID